VVSNNKAGLRDGAWACGLPRVLRAVPRENGGIETIIASRNENNGGVDLYDVYLHRDQA